ncbi:hypothetical protein M885DRAFT_623276 [Pelagophyceae sp. CCMP2097]|nr:hypothetical protein M885DRAFT_623276 [Pelagophyceae sp. CCMP2097]
MSALSARVFYAVYGAACMKDWLGVFYGGLTNRPGDAVRKPLGYKANVLRRPLWCSAGLLRTICADETQKLAFSLVVLGCAAAAAAPDAPWAWALRLLIACCGTAVEVRFHAATGWHRFLLGVNFLWSYTLPAAAGPPARLLALAHAYGGSGATRLRAQGLRAAVCGAGAEMRVLLEAARASGNVIYPRLNDALLAAPDAALSLAGAAGRMGFEVVFVTAVLLRSRDARLRIAFRVAALCFHQGIALCLAVDFVENKLMLLCALVDEVGWSDAALDWPAAVWLAVFSAGLVLPVLLEIEAFPGTHWGLFPYSAPQIQALRQSVGRNSRVRMLATTRGRIGAPGDLDGAYHIDLAPVCLGCSDVQPAQFYNRAVFGAAMHVLEQRRVVVCSLSPHDALEELLRWLEHEPLLEPRTYAALRTVAIVELNATGKPAKVLCSGSTRENPKHS